MPFGHLKRHKFAFKFYEMDPCLLPIQEIPTLTIKFSGENIWESPTQKKSQGPAGLNSGYEQIKIQNHQSWNPLGP